MNLGQAISPITFWFDPNRAIGIELLRYRHPGKIMVAGTKRTILVGEDNGPKKGVVRKKIYRYLLTHRRVNSRTIAAGTGIHNDRVKIELSPMMHLGYVERHGEQPHVTWSAVK